MEALIIKPANDEEATLLKDLIKKMKVKYTVLNDEDKEDFGFARAILTAKDSKEVTEESIFKKLRK